MPLFAAESLHPALLTALLTALSYPLSLFHKEAARIGLVHDQNQLLNLELHLQLV